MNGSLTPLYQPGIRLRDEPAPTLDRGRESQPGGPWCTTVGYVSGPRHR